MNKFFRLVSMFAIAGVTFAYTSCTDYSEDINKVDNRVDNVEGRLTTVEGQVKNLETTTTQLKGAQAKTDAAVKTLETTLKELQTKHDKDIADLQKAYADADAALKTEIQGKIDALETAHNDEVKKINNAIKALQEDVKALQEKATAVEALIPTLATKKELEEASKKTADAIAKVNETIGALQGNLEIAQKNITALQGTVTTLEGDVAGLKTAVEKAQKAADAAQTAADKAQSDATLALGKIEALTKALGKYAEVGALESKIAALEKMDSTLQADKFDTEKFGTFFAKELKDVIGAYAEKGALQAKLDALDGKDEDLQDQINKLDAKVEQYNTALNDRITKLDEKVEQYNTELNARIDAVLGIIAGRLSSIVFVPEYYYDGVPAILFETIAYDPLADANENEVAENKINGKQNSVDVNRYTRFTSALAKAQYRLNPRTVGVDCADFSFVGDKADYVVTRATAPAAPVSIEGVTEYDPATGYVTFTVKKNEKLNVTDNTNKNLDIVALKAVLKKGLTDAEAKAEQKPEVYSEYAHINEIAYSAANLAISDKKALAAKEAHEYAKTFDAAAAQAPVYEMPYNSDPFDLKALVATCINTNITTPGLEAAQNHAELNLDNYELDYKFSVAKTSYKVTSGATETDQQTVIECVDADNGLYKVKAANNAEFNKEAIGRTPIVRVDLMHNGFIVTRAFIKLVITVTKAPDLPVPTPAKNIVLSCPQTEVDFVVSEEDMRNDVYRVLNISHEEFWNTYHLGDRNVTINGNEYATFTKPELLSGVSDDGTATKKVVWNFTHGEVGKIEGGKTVVGTLVLVNKLASSPLPKHVVFTFTANFTLPAVAIDVTRNEIFWKDNMYQVNVNVPETKDADAEKCQFDNKMYTANAIGEQAWKNFVVKNVPCNETGKFVIAYVKENGEKIPYDKSSKGIYLVTVDDVTYIRLNKADNNVKAALNSANGLQAELKYEITYKSGDVVYPKEGEVVVNFIRPLNLNMPEGLSVKDAVTGGDKVDFNHTNLLTDWRGEAVLADVEVPVTKNWYEWVKVCGQNDGHKLQWIPDTQVIETPAQLEVDYQTITIPTGGVYFSATVQLYDYSYGWVKARSYTAKGRSAAESIQNALTIAKSKEPEHYFDSVDRNHKYEIENIKEDTTSETIEFQSVKTVNYIPAKYKTIPGYWAYADCTDMPAVNGDYAGQTVGCYEWTLKSAPDTKVVPGQYWNYYGPISEVTLDVKNVKTNLPDEKLPAKASLVQTGTTVTYMNVESPINSDYKLFIPAKVTYGWGTINATLEIDVKKL